MRFKHLNRKAPLFLMLCGSFSLQAINSHQLFAQDNKTAAKQIAVELVTGKVRNATGEPVVGASVFVKGSQTGTVTKNDGSFSIRAKKGDVLLISSVGFANQQWVVGSKSTAEISLVAENANLEEVVVTGFQTISKDKATGSYEKISGETMKQRPTKNILDKLDGMVAGVSVNVGENGSTGRVEVRGRNTLLAQQTPLYVVDGFPLSGNVLTVNPEDIESMFVLKDAAATAQWGVQASNGVIVITTKKAKGNKVNVDYSSFLTIDEAVKFSKMNWMSVEQEMELDQEYIDKKWFSFPTLISSKSTFNQIQLANIYKQGFSPDGQVWSDNTFNNFIYGLSKNDAVAQWEKLMFRNGVHQTHNISIAANTERNNLYASVVYNDDLLKEVGNSENRIILNLRDEFKASKKLSFSLSLNASMRRQKNNGMSASTVAGSVNAYDNLVDAYGNSVQYYNRWDPWTSKARQAMPGYFSYGFSHLDEQRNRDNNNSQMDYRAQFGVNYEVIPGLKLESKFQYEKGFSRLDNYASMDLPSFRIQVNDMYLGSTTKEYQIPLGTRYNYSRFEMYSLNWRNTLNFQKRIGQHDFSLLTGFDIKQVFSESFADQVFGFDKQTNTILPINTKDYAAGAKFNWNGERQYFTIYSTSSVDTREVGFYAMPGYTFNGKYTINANYRIDQKNLFGSDPRFRYKPLWSVGGAWNISKEKFVSDINFIDRLNLKGSYGITGNASNSYSPYAQARNSNASWGANLFNYLVLTQPANPNLKWEETRALNLALEFSLFKGKLNGSVAYYREKSVDLLGTRLLDPTNGFASGVVNYASVTNRGTEITLSAPIINKKDLRWDVSMNLSYNKNNVYAIDDQKYTPNSIAFSGDLTVGMPIENMYSFNYAGLSNGGEPMLYNTDKTTKSWRKFVSSKDELLYHGTTIAPYYGGLQTTVAYKGFDLTVNASFKAGHYFRYYVNTGYTGSGSSRMFKLWDDRWRQPGDENNTRVPKIAYEGVNPYTGISETRWDNIDGDQYFTYGQDFVYKADFIKVRDIILGYELPKNLVKKAAMSSLRLSLQVTNPLQWFKNPVNLDPENWSNAGWSNLKTVTFGLRASF